METSDSPDLTPLLQRWNEGDERAASEIFPLVYDELRRIAARFYQSERPGHTLQPTAIIHEAYINLCQGRKVDWQDQSHFFCLMARVMRRVLVDHARQRRRSKRGGDQQRVDLDHVASQGFDAEKTHELIAVDDALLSLAKVDAQKAAIIELRFFGGLTIKETAEVLGIAESTVVREYRRAKAWLYREISMP